MGYGAWAVAVAVMGGGCGRGGHESGGPFLSRPAPGPDGRVAFVSQSRVWIADAGPAHDRRALALPIDLPADRPRWLVDSASTRDPRLALNVWCVKSGGAGKAMQADLAIWNETALERLTQTPESELLDDAAAGDRILFERNGMLCEAAIERPLGGARLGPVTELTPGRDGRYTPDGQHILFARGHESDPLGFWHQGYQGGDDSEIYHLDLATRSVTQLTDTPDNDELPVPLDNDGRRFIVCRERDEMCYRPWIVEIITLRKHRVRRLPMPDGAWPVLFPAVRWLKPPPRSPLAALVEGDTSLSLELWAEADGVLVMTRGAVRPSKLAFPPATRVRMRLLDRGPKFEAPDSLFGDQAGQMVWKEITRAIDPGLTISAQNWKAIPAPVRSRFQVAFTAAKSEPERTELILRLLGRLDFRGFAYAPPGEWAGSKGVPSPPVVPSDRAEPWVYDLRGIAADSSAGSEVASFCGKPPISSGVVLIDEKTAGEAEFVAGLLRMSCKAVLIGRTTSGLATYIARSVLSTGAVLTVPVAPREIGLHDGVQPGGVVPDRFVPPGASEDVWQAAVNEARERLRQ